MIKINSAPTFQKAGSEIQSVTKRDCRLLKLFMSFNIREMRVTRSSFCDLNGPLNVVTIASCNNSLAGALRVL